MGGRGSTRVPLATTFFNGAAKQRAQRTPLPPHLKKLGEGGGEGAENHYAFSTTQSPNPATPTYKERNCGVEQFLYQFTLGLTRNASTACHPLEGGDPELFEKTGFPPEFTLTKVGAGMTAATYSRRFA
jgi:hypothetical protein